MPLTAPVWAGLAVGAWFALVWLPVRVDLALYALVALGVLAVLRPPPARRAGWRWPDLPLLLWLLASGLSIALADDRARALVLSSALVPGTFLYLLTSRWLSLPAGGWLVAGGLGVAVAGLAALLLGQALLVPGAGTLGADLVKAAHSPVLLVPNDLLFAAIAVPLVLGLTWSAPWRGARVLAGLVAALALVAIVLAQSRSALLALALAALVPLWLLRRTLPWRRLALVAGGLGVAAVAVDALNGFALLGKFGSLCFSRGPFWSAAWQLFLEQPWFGHGAHSFVYLYPERLPTDPALFCAGIEPRLTPWPHNLWLELLSAQGLAGTLPFLAAALWALVTCWRRIGQTGGPALAGLLAAWLAWWLAALLELSLLRLWVVATLALLFGLTVRLTATVALAQANDGGRGRHADEETNG